MSNLETVDMARFTSLQKFYEKNPIRLPVNFVGGTKYAVCVMARTEFSRRDIFLLSDGKVWVLPGARMPVNMPTAFYGCDHLSRVVNNVHWLIDIQRPTCRTYSSNTEHTYKMLSADADLKFIQETDVLSSLAEELILGDGGCSINGIASAIETMIRTRLERQLNYHYSFKKLFEAALAGKNMDKTIGEIWTSKESSDYIVPQDIKMLAFEITQYIKDIIGLGRVEYDVESFKTSDTVNLAETSLSAVIVFRELMKGNEK